MAEHVREHRSLLAAAEKRLLIAIAQRLPLWIHSDHLTGLALAAMAARWCGVCRWRGGTRARSGWSSSRWQSTGSATASTARWPASASVERPRYGFYVDHVLDIVGITLLFGGLACLAVHVAGHRAGAARGVSARLWRGVSRDSGHEACSGCRLPASVRPNCGSCWRSEPSHCAAIRTSVSALLGRVPLFDFGGLVAIGWPGVDAGWLSATRNAVALARLEPPASQPSLRRSGRRFAQNPGAVGTIARLRIRREFVTVGTA